MNNKEYDDTFRIVKIDYVSGKTQFAVQQNIPSIGPNGGIFPIWETRKLFETEKEAIFMYNEVIGYLVKKITVIKP